MPIFRSAAATAYSGLPTRPTLVSPKNLSICLRADQSPRLRELCRLERALSSLITSSLPGSTRQSNFFFRKKEKMDPRVKPAGDERDTAGLPLLILLSQEGKEGPAGQARG